MSQVVIYLQLPPRRHRRLLPRPTDHPYFTFGLPRHHRPPKARGLLPTAYPPRTLVVVFPRHPQLHGGQESKTFYIGNLRRPGIRHHHRPQLHVSELRLRCPMPENTHTRNRHIGLFRPRLGRRRLHDRRRRPLKTRKKIWVIDSPCLPSSLARETTITTRQHHQRRRRRRRLEVRYRHRRLVSRPRSHRPLSFHHCRPRYRQQVLRRRHPRLLHDLSLCRHLESRLPRYHQQARRHHQRPLHYHRQVHLHPLRYHRRVHQRPLRCHRLVHQRPLHQLLPRCSRHHRHRHRRVVLVSRHRHRHLPHLFREPARRLQLRRRRRRRQQRAVTRATRLPPQQPRRRQGTPGPRCWAISRRRAA